VKAEILPRLARPLGIVVDPFPQLEVGTPDELIEAARLFAPREEGRVPGCYVHPTATPGGRLRRCILGPGARIPDHLEDSNALWHEACGRQVRLAL